MGRMSKAEEGIRRFDEILYRDIVSDNKLLARLARETNSWQTTQAKRTREKIRNRIQDTSLQRQTCRQIAYRAGFDLPSGYPSEAEEEE